jgi:hypothetical protein
VGDCLVYENTLLTVRLAFFALMIFRHEETCSNGDTPVWVMFTAGCFVAIGVCTFGSRVIYTVGKKIAVNLDFHKVRSRECHHYIEEEDDLIGWVVDGEKTSRWAAGGIAPPPPFYTVTHALLLLVLFLFFIFFFFFFILFILFL